MYSYSVINSLSLGEGIEASLKELHNNARTVFGENQDRSDELKEISLVMCVSSPLSEPSISKMMPSGLTTLSEYVEEMVNGSRDFEPNWEYTYHKLYSQYYDSLLKELKRNSSTRRASIAVGGEINFENPHPPCLQLMMFNIRENKLHLSVVFRSNDAAKAFSMNAFALVMLLKKTADDLNLEVGTYTHISESFHCYSADYQTLENYVTLMDTLDEKKRFYSLNQFYTKQKSHLSDYYDWIKNRRLEIGFD